VSIALIWPQCYISWQKFGTLNPLSQTAVGQSQIAYGVEMLHFSATFTEGKFSPFTIWSPYHELPLSEQNSAFYLNHPKEGLFLVTTHVWSGLHYVAVVPYIPEADISIVNLWLLGSAVIVCFGALGLPRLFVPGERGAALMLAGLTILSCVYTAFVATENRFGLIGFAALVLRGVMFATVRDPYVLVVVQVFDGITAAVFAVMLPLIVADITFGSGHFNLAQGIVGTATGIGASLSTVLAGYVSDKFGSSTAFMGLAAIAAAGLVMIYFAMPETCPTKRR